MTWRTFVEKIQESGLLNKVSKDQVVIQLFRAAGCMHEFTSTSTAKKWITGDRKCKANKYFPDSKLNNISGAINFFKNRDKSKLQRFQKLFFEAGDKDSPIDVETNDMGIFCQSLVNQFLDLLGFERLDIPDTNALFVNNEFANDSQSSYKTEIPKDGITDLESLPYENVKTDISVQKDIYPDTGAQISIPQACKSCFYCKNWHGNVKDAPKSTVGIYGKCLLFQKEVLSSNTNTCDKFDPAYGRIPLFNLV